MVQFWITLQKLVQYNIKIIFGNKFLYFMLSALAFYVITVIVKLLGDDEITQATAYSMLMLPSILLVFYPMCSAYRTIRTPRSWRLFSESRTIVIRSGYYASSSLT